MTYTPYNKDVTSQIIDFCRADKVIFGEAAGGMGAVADGAGFIAEGYVRMMVFAVRHPGHRIHKSDGLVIIFKGEGSHDFFTGELPARYVREQNLYFIVGQRKHTAFTRFAMFAFQVIGIVRHSPPPFLYGLTQSR